MKSKKKNPALKLVILCAVAVVLAVAYACLNAANRKKAEEEQRAALEAMQTSVTVAAFDPAELTELTYE